MNKAKLSYGLNLTKKPGGLAKPTPPKRKPLFAADDDSDDDQGQGGKVEQISELDDFGSSDIRTDPSGTSARTKNGPLSRSPAGRHKAQITQFGDLSSALSSRKYAEEAEKLDPSIYDYDASYDSFKAPKKSATAEKERRPQYMTNLRKAAEVRERDRKIAEDKKMQREREQEGDEYADKEKFVTGAYKRQQEENRRLEEEERRKEEQEAKNNKSGAMTGFYQQLLDRGEQRHAEIMRAAEEQQKGSQPAEERDKEADSDKVKTDVDMAREINEKGGPVAINEDGQVVDKRQLLRGGLNVGAKKKAEVQKEREASRNAASGRDRDTNQGVFAGGKQAMRDRQSRMLEEQYEQALKRSRDEEEQERQKIELESKSRKTGSEISSAKERYLARKRAEAEAKKNGTAELP